MLLLTTHAAQRMQQRAIPTEAIELLLDFGSSARCDGADSFFFDRKVRQRLADGLDVTERRHSKRYLNAYAVVGNNGHVITVARRTRRLSLKLKDNASGTTPLRSRQHNDPAA